MKRFVTLAALLLLSSPFAWSADSQQDTQAQIMNMQKAQAKLMTAMIIERPSRLGFNETVATLLESARKRGWDIGQVMDMQDIMLKAGHKDAKPFKILSLCKKNLTETLLKVQAANKALPFAPCRMSVFEGKDGMIYIAKPNTELMSQLAMPVFVPYLQQIATEEQAVLTSVLK